MQKNDRILALLRIIQDQKNSLSIHDILSNLEEKVAKRTIRRWLDELAKMGLIQKIGHKKGMRYQAAHNTTLAVEKHPAKSLLFSDASIQSVSHVKQPLYLREPATYHTDWIEAYKPNETFYLTPAHQELLRGLGERRHNHDLAGTYARHIFNRLLIDLSYNSSRLEGNTYSLLETEKLVLEGNLPANKLNEEAVMILNHKEAIRYLVENVGKIQIEPQVVFTVHYLLADGLLPADACGLVRTHGVKVGGSVYVPLADKRKLEQYLSLACKKAALIQNPYEQSFFLLVHIAYLQAFEDCNKRTSRLSANIPLIRENLVPLSFNDVTKDDYTDAMLAIYELNKVQPLIDLYLYSYARTCKQYDVSIESTGFDRIKIQYRQERRELIREIVKRKLTAASMTRYIEKQSISLIPQIDREAFRTAILEDIAVLAISHIKGMGIDAAEFDAWKDKSKIEHRKK